MSLTLAQPLTPQWHEQRRAGIGASEIAAVMGISPWESPFSLYWRKVNGWDFEATPEMEWGTRLEEAIASKYGDEHKAFLESPGLVAHPLRPWHLATPDRTVRPYCDCPDEVCVPTERLGIPRCTVCDGWGYGPVDRVLEIKTAHTPDGWGEPGTDQIPVYYRAQVQWQMCAVGVNAGDIAVLIGGSDYREYSVELDPKDLNVMIEHGRRFMARIAAGDPPPLDDHHATLNTIKRLHPDLDDEQADVDRDVAAGYLRACRMAKKAAAVRDRYEIQLRAQMGRAKRAIAGGRKVATRTISEIAESTRTVAAHRRDYLTPAKEPKP